MSAALAIRRLRLTALTAHDHPDPAGLSARLAEAARRNLPDALKQPLQSRHTGAVTRIRRLKLDITLAASADDEAFASLLAQAIAEALRAAEAPEGTDENVVSFATREAHLAAMLEALAAGRAAECWWLRDAEGLRFLSPPAALRTALLAEPALGQAALLSMPPARQTAILAALGAREAEHVLDALAAIAPAASPEFCARAIIALTAPAGSTALTLYLRACATPGASGPALAATARLYAALAILLEAAEPFAPPHLTLPETLVNQDAAVLRAVLAASSALPDSACTIILDALGMSAAALASLKATGSVRHTSQRRPTTVREPHYSRFAGLLLLVPSLDFYALAEAAQEEAPLIACSALGLCAGRGNFAAWLRDPAWRTLFGLDERATGLELAEQLGAIPAGLWQNLAPLGQPPATWREAKFLLPARNLLGGKNPAAQRTLAALANALGQKFTRRLSGLRTASAPFLWDNLLGAGGVFEPGEGVWHARLNRPPLDVLLSLSRLAEGSVQLPNGTVRLSRAAA